MMLGSGRHGSARILSRPAVETMTSDHLTDAQRPFSGWCPAISTATAGASAFAVATRRTDLATTPGRFGWDGGLGTSWYADPREDVPGILMTQRAWTSPMPPPVCRDFWTLAYQAIDD